MRHRVYGKHLGRDKDQRKLLFKGLIYSLFSYGTIQTSEVKSKAIKGLVDRIINSVKVSPKSPKPLVQSFISDKRLQKRLTDEILPKMGNRTSGYTKIIKIGTRSGDQTMIVKMSLIGAEELKPLMKESDKKAEEELNIKKAAPVKKEVTKKVATTRKAVTTRRQSRKRVSK